MANKGISFGGKIIIGLMLLAAAAGGLVMYWQSMLEPAAAQEKTPVIVDIPANSSSASVAKMLEDKHLIKSGLAFRIYSRYKGLDSKIQTGEYQLSAAMSVPEIMNQLVKGRQVLYSFTVPEGYTVEEIAAMLAQKGYADKDKFIQLCKEGDFNYSFLKGAQNTNYALEGYLFPDTYKISKMATEEEIISMMLERFAAEIDKLNFAQKAEELNLSVHQAVTIASMIEKEAVVAKDRPLISGVIQNRLKKGMPLQIDATVLYALGEHKELVLNKDLQVDSPYNTYKTKSLPPGPIASPGEASLKAAVNPETHSYLYYVAKPDGSHSFSTTLDEHNQKKAKYL